MGDRRPAAPAAGDAGDPAGGSGERRHDSAISIWEVAKNVEKGQLVFDRPVRDWIVRATTVEGLFVGELTPAILLESCTLPPPFHGDPADQMIVASARHARRS